MCWPSSGKLDGRSIWLKCQKISSSQVDSTKQCYLPFIILVVPSFFFVYTFQRVIFSSLNLRFTRCLLTSFRCSNYVEICYFFLIGHKFMPYIRYNYCIILIGVCMWLTWLLYLSLAQLTMCTYTVLASHTIHHFQFITNIFLACKNWE